MTQVDITVTLICTNILQDLEVTNLHQVIERLRQVKNLNSMIKKGINYLLLKSGCTVLINQG